MVHSRDIPTFMKYRPREFPRLFPNGAYPPNTLLMIDCLGCAIQETPQERLT